MAVALIKKWRDNVQWNLDHGMTATVEARAFHNGRVDAWNSVLDLLGENSDD